MNLQEITQYADLFAVLLNAQEESSLFVSDTNTFIYSNDKYGLGIRVGDRIKKDSVTQLVIEQNQTISKAVDRVGSSYAKEYFATGVPLRDDSGAPIGAITWVSHNHKATLEKMGRELALLSREILDASHMFATTTETLALKNHDAYSSIVELDTNIKHIQKMNRVISDIANQTHMLGLNAAIESARAGEAGRGFSVVASEVQKLATQSKNSAKEITQLIGQTSSSMMHAMEVIQENNNESNQQAAYAKELDSMVQRLESLAKQLDQNADKDVVMTWNDSFSVHDTMIDSQHKGLLNLINDLYSAMKHNRSKDVLGKVISQLIDYTAKHFTYEEQHMKRIGYPELPGHTKQHQKFVAEVLEFQKAFQEGKTTVSYEIIEFLKDWLMNHILVSDKKYDSTVFHA